MPDRDRLIAEILDHESRLGRLHARQRAGPLFDLQLTMQQLRVLFLVHLESRATGHGLAATLGVSQATVSGIVDRLVSHDLVRRVDDPADRRVRLLELTPAGQKVVDDFQGAGAELRRGLLCLLDTDSLADLERVLGELVRRVRDAEHDPGAGRAP